MLKDCCPEWQQGQVVEPERGETQREVFRLWEGVPLKEMMGSWSLPFSFCFAPDYEASGFAPRMCCHVLPRHRPQPIRLEPPKL